MCGRIGFDIHPGQLAERFPWLRIPEDLPPRYNVPPTQPLFVIDEEAEEASLLRWGIDGRSRTGHFNLREETVASNPRYRNLPPVIIPVSHFYEWSGRQPMKIARADGRPLLIAGLRGCWEGQPAVTMITTAASGPVALFHHRMPVLLELGELSAVPVSLLVNDVRNDGPELLLPPHEYQLELLG
jgi:putative SOS response-associated peptidase YedK